MIHEEGLGVGIVMVIAEESRNTPTGCSKKSKN